MRRLWFQVVLVLGVLAAILWGSNKALEICDRQAASGGPETVTIQRKTVLQAYLLMASAIPGVEVEAHASRSEHYETRVLVIVPADADPDTVWAIESLGNVLPLEECGIEVRMLEP